MPQPVTCAACGGCDHRPGGCGQRDPRTAITSPSGVICGQEDGLDGADAPEDVEAEEPEEPEEPDEDEAPDEPDAVDESDDPDDPAEPEPDGTVEDFDEDERESVR